MDHHDSTVQFLAQALLNGVWDQDSLVSRATKIVPGESKRLEKIIVEVLARFGPHRRPSRLALCDFLRSNETLNEICEDDDFAGPSRVFFPATMLPALGPPESWRVPTIVSSGELAERLGLSIRQLDWFADGRGLERFHKCDSLRHYRYHWMKKRKAGSARLIEAPKLRLKTIQTRILASILDRIPPHRAAHGFTLGKSIRTFVEAHTSKAVVLRFDIRDFFPSISRARVVGLFRTIGYPDDVAQVLARLCTNQVPSHVWQSFPAYGGTQDLWRHQALFQRPHLPQGAPTSPALANLCAYRLDCRLWGLASSLGCSYSRYADDLIISGDRTSKRFVACVVSTVTAIASEEGFQTNLRKTRVMRSGTSQRAVGLVLNSHPNVSRPMFDRLKATLHNCVRQGPVDQNRTGHLRFREFLQGQVAFVEFVNPSRGAKLRRIFEQIRW